MKKEQVLPNIDPNEMVQVKWTERDEEKVDWFLNRRLISFDDWLDSPVYKIKTLTKSEVVTFCDGCDLLNESGGCNLGDGERSQPIYVARNWCGWTEENGISGFRTSAGFVSRSNI